MPTICIDCCENSKEAFTTVQFLCEIYFFLKKKKDEPKICTVWIKVNSVILQFIFFFFHKKAFTKSLWFFSASQKQ